MRKPYTNEFHKGIHVLYDKTHTNKYETQDLFSFSTESHPKLHECLQYVCVSRTDFIPNLIKSASLSGSYRETIAIFFSTYSKKEIHLPAVANRCHKANTCAIQRFIALRRAIKKGLAFDEAFMIV